MAERSSIKTYGFIAGGLLLFGLLIFGLEKLASQDGQSQNQATIATEKDTKKQGPSDTKITLLEYSDFQCPACAGYEPLVRDLRKDFPDTLQLVFRHFPLTSIHKNAMLSAKAAEAANMQGKFWQMHDQLFEHQSDWAKSENPLEIFQAYAKNIDLNVEKFTADIESQSVAETVLSDQSLGNDADIPGTPSFFLNGKALKNPKNYEEFKKMIEDELRSKNQ